MLSHIQKRVDSAEAKREAILKAVANMSEEEQKRPRKNGWSPLQIVEHLVLAEELFSDYITAATAQAGMLPARNPLTGFLVGLGSVMMNLSLPMPSPSNMAPRSNNNLAALRERWTTSRHVLRERMEQVTAKQRKKTIALHAKLGRMNADEVLSLLDAHLNYHLKQLR